MRVASFASAAAVQRAMRSPLSASAQGAPRANEMVEDTRGSLATALARRGFAGQPAVAVEVALAVVFLTTFFFGSGLIRNQLMPSGARE